MKYIKKYNESFKDIVVTKSEKEFLKNLDNEKPEVIFAQSVRHNLPDGIKKAIDLGVNPAKGDNYYIQVAAERGCDKSIKELLKDKRVNPTANNGFALDMASMDGHIEAVKELLKDKRFKDTSSSLVSAAKNGHKNIVEIFLKDNRFNSNTATIGITMALSNGYKEIAKMLFNNEEIKSELSEEDIEEYWEKISK